LGEALEAAYDDAKKNGVLKREILFYATT